jgi:cytoskeletal protein RodZ
MRKQGGGFGFVMLLVVLIIIFFVAMRNFESVAPSAMAIQEHNAVRKSADGAAPEQLEPKQTSTSASADSWTPAPPSRPNLSTMDQKTTEHTSDVQDALSQSN